MSSKLLELPIEARIRLVEDLWDSIAAEQSKLPLTEAQRAELDFRLDEFEIDGELGAPAEVILSQIRASL
ncbi:MAG: addiction module protein [Gammaproteobacteria bacterium]